MKVSMSTVFLPVSIFLIGLIIGSFLNVVILRINTGRSFVRGRSSCARCSRTLSWYELIPVFSFLGLRGSCRTCKQPISFQYPLVELITGIVFVMLFSSIVIANGFSFESFGVYIYSLFIAACLIIIMVYDMRHKIIPDSIVYPFIVFSFLSIVFRALVSHSSSFSLFSELISGVAVALPLFLLWAFSKGKLMGFGDVKLMLGIGWLAGVLLGFEILIFSFWIGGVVGLFLLALTKKYGMKSEVPFAPFLIMATFLVLVLNVTISVPIWL